MFKELHHKERKEHPPTALFARKISPAQVPQTGFPSLTNSRRAGNWKGKGDNKYYRTQFFGVTSKISCLYSTEPLSK